MDEERQVLKSLTNDITADMLSMLPNENGRSGDRAEA
jgi:hypothetical protein